MSEYKPSVDEAQPLDTAAALAEVLDRVASRTFRDDLIDAGLLIPTGVDGLYGRSEVFESVVEAINRLVTQRGADQGAEVMRFPPAMNRTDFEDSEYLKSFPNLAGTVHSFCGGEREHHRLLKCLDDGEDWMDNQKPTRLVLTPAACYPCYPVVAKRGPLPPEGRTIDVFSYCFRHEPSLDPARMQMFRMREYVRMGTPDQIVQFRAMWIERGKALIETLGLPYSFELANDPFFGRGGKIVADSQRAQELKFELLIPIESEEKPTACLSFNYHMDHFGEIWKFHTADGAVAHTGCVGFGMERTTLALFGHHGLDVANWPVSVREALWDKQ